MTSGESEDVSDGDITDGDGFAVSFAFFRGSSFLTIGAVNFGAELDDSFVSDDSFGSGSRSRN
jgi:hypothetical protein